MTHQIARDLLNWYAQNGRQLPWRRSRDPYAVWIAEVMLQQTQVQTVVPYYERWLAEFPDIATLAHAPLDRVLQVWEGLGYYRRAHNLHRAARSLMQHHRGTLPSLRRELAQLPGIGLYTSAAIAAIAFDADEVAVDGNIRRVFARLFDLDGALNSVAATRRLERMAGMLMPTGTAASFNQAVMDLGAMVCTARVPECHACPLHRHCRAFANGTQADRPARDGESPKPWVVRLSAAIIRGDRVLLRRRPKDGLLASLWEFPGTDLEPSIEVDPALATIRKLERYLGLILSPAEALGDTRHTYTHFRHRLFAWSHHVQGELESDALEGPTAWVPIDSLSERPMGKIDRWIAQQLTDRHVSTEDVTEA